MQNTIYEIDFGFSYKNHNLKYVGVTNRTCNINSRLQEHIDEVLPDFYYVGKQNANTSEKKFAYQLEHKQRVEYFSLLGKRVVDDEYIFNHLLHGKTNCENTKHIAFKTAILLKAPITIKEIMSIETATDKQRQHIEQEHILKYKTNKDIICVNSKVWGLKPIVFKDIFEKPLNTMEKSDLVFDRLLLAQCQYEVLPKYQHLVDCRGKERAF